MKNMPGILVLALSLSLPAAADPLLEHLQIADGTPPGEKPGDEKPKDGTKEDGKDGAKGEGVVVEAGSLEIKEEAPVGPYKQPVWTTHRRFPSTRVYIQQGPGEAGLEAWVEVRIPKGTKKATETRLRQELEVGLGYRLQLDFYILERHIRDYVDSSFEWRGFSAEVRWAIADWNVIPGNPTLYFEYLLLNGEADKIEPKLLLGGDIIPKLHWGVNLVWEHRLAARLNRDDEFKFTGAVAYGIIDNILSLGAELEYAYEVEVTDGDVERTNEWLVGPSIQFRPIEHAHLDIAPLWGISHDAKRAKIYAVFGWDF